MADTTVERVWAIAGHLKEKDHDDMQVFVDDAIQEVEDANVPGRYEERLQRYLAAHLATIDQERPDSMSVADLSLGYNRPGGLYLSSSKYGQEYARLLRRVLGGYLRTM